MGADHSPSGVEHHCEPQADGTTEQQHSRWRALTLGTYRASTTISASTRGGLRQTAVLLWMQPRKPAPNDTFVISDWLHSLSQLREAERAVRAFAPGTMCGGASNFAEGSTGTVWKVAGETRAARGVLPFVSVGL